MVDGLLEEAQHYVAHYGTSVVFLGVFLESFGLPTPGESLMIAGSILASQGKLNIFSVAFASWVAAVMGDNIGYLIGRKGGRVLVLRYGPKFRIKNEHIKYVEGFFDRHGGAVVLFARFVVVLRQLNGIVAGTMGMNWWHFLAYNSLGAALWVGFWTSLAYWFGKRFNDILRTVSTFEPAVVVIAVVAAAAAAVYFFWRRKRGRKRRNGRR
ncbi:MAG TPA: DedA family protein [Stellaceae bacterium]|nr:DedA family protein [Stellaceae bacterium]